MAQAMVKKSPWARFGKAINIVVLVAFFMPFFGVSCDGIDVITVSGTDMAFGCTPGGAAAAASEEEDVKGMGGGVKIDKVDIEPLAIVALALVVAGIALSFLKGRRMLTGSLVVAVLSIGALIGLWVKVGGEINHEIADQMKEDMGKSSMMKDSKVESGTRMGLWIALAGLVGVAGLAGMALRDREALPESVPPGGPEGPGASMA